ncbi:MAG: ABC transporter ATP-binding protein [Anaerolineales bacterium]|nr:ABC transporter ATP-binding protein [Anaerolineales bacterium]
MPEILTLQGVTKTFGGLVAVDHVGFSIHQGQILGLIGPNGAGKTTIFNCISCLYHATSGEIYFHNERITHKPHSAIAQLGISRTFQQLRLFRGMTALENVLIGAHTKGHAGLIGALLCDRKTKDEEIYLRERAMHYLDLLGLADKSNWKVGSLSYGDKRRVEVARALVAEPELLLLDEPSAGMNVKESQQLSQFIQWIRTDLNKTVLLIEHNMRVVMSIADHVVVTNQGKKIFEGSPYEAQNAPQVIEAYLGEAYLRRYLRSRENVKN